MNMQNRGFAWTFLIMAGLLVRLNAQGQTEEMPAETVVPIVLLKQIEIKKMSPAGSSSVWNKVICEYESTKTWIDGIGFQFEVLLKPLDDAKGKPKVAQAMVSFANVPKGKNVALVYLPPGAAKRYGNPVAVKVTCFSSDDMVGTLNWNAKDSGVVVDGSWISIYNRIEGALLPLRFTPFVSTDYDLMPDSLAQ